MRDQRLHDRDHGVAVDRVDEGLDARVVAAARGDRDDGFGHEVRKPADRARGSRRAGSSEIGFVADQNREVAVRLDQAHRGLRVGSAVLHPRYRRRKGGPQAGDELDRERNAGEARNVVQDHVAKVLADAAEHLREPGENGVVRNRPEVEWRRQEHRLRPPSQRRSRALGRLLDRAGDHTLDELFRRYAGPHEPGRRRLTLPWRNGRALAGRAEERHGRAAAPEQIPCVGGKRFDVDLAVAPEGGHQSGTDAEAQRVAQTRSSDPHRHD